jgi:hypothetical protein
MNMLCKGLGELRESNKIIVNSQKTFDAAKLDCRKMGKVMVAPKTLDENACIQHFLLLEGSHTKILKYFKTKLDTFKFFKWDF